MKHSRAALVTAIRGLEEQKSAGGHAQLFRSSRYQGETQLNLETTNLMISWAITFLIIAIIAALLGFTSIMGTSLYIAKILFFVFIVMFVISLLMGRRAPPV